jgi:hypothetical protein
MYYDFNRPMYDLQVESIKKGGLNPSERGISYNKKSNKKEESGFDSILTTECMKYTDDIDKINKIVGG